jgi:HAD superfamily hydrolase (TIGR01509 family)
MKTILVDAVYCFMIEKDGKFQILDEMYNLLETYQNKKIILTGANDEQIIKFGLNNIPYEFFTLKHNPEKTDPKYYEILLEKYNLKKEDVIYFEHSMEAVKSAESIGINTYYYDNDKKDLESLKEFLDKNLNQ